tara:strand:- start:676 stop:939 length:264 start_codon:yes stop_codon:yes gene_type:complete
MFKSSPIDMKISLYAGLIAILLNIVLSASVMPFATTDQMSPPNGAENLSYFSQFIHMLFNQNQLVLTSSLMIFKLVYVSTIISLSMR